MDPTSGSALSNAHPFETGCLSMSDEELSVLERNRRLTRRIMVPLMSLMGTCGLAGGIFAIATDTVAIGIGLTVSALSMLGFAIFYAVDTRKPVVRPEKFFVTGVITRKRKRGGAFTYVYYELKLSDDRYTCFVSKKDFERLKQGDVVQCERLEESSVFADRVVVLGTK